MYDSLAMKVIIPAHKLENATCQFISLVRAGANRIPFRITKNKEEQRMINLDRIVKGVRKATDIAPKIVAIVVNKAETGMDVVTKAVKDAGFSVEKMEEQTGEQGTAVIFSQEDNVDFSKVLAIKFDNMVVLVKGFDPYAYNGGQGSFSENLKAQGFLPSVNVAFDALRTTLMDRLTKAETGGGDVVSQIDSDLLEFHKYVLNQAKAIPASAFKLDAALKTLYTKAQHAGECPVGQHMVDGKCVPMTDEKKQKEVDDAAAAKKVVDEKIAKEAVAKAEADAKVKTEQEVAAKAAAAQKSETEKALDAIKETMGMLTTSVSEVSKSVQAMTVKVIGLESKLGEVEGVAKSAMKSVKGTIAASAGAGDSAPGTTKEVPAGGTLDTAFDRTTRKSAFGPRKAAH